MTEPEIWCRNCHERLNPETYRGRCPHCGWREYDPDSELHPPDRDEDSDGEWAEYQDWMNDERT